MTKGFSIKGLNHLGIIVSDIELAKEWFLETLGFKLIEDRGELFFFMCGNDVLAAKTPAMAVSKPEHGAEREWQDKAGWQTLDHYGFYAAGPEEVDKFAEYVATKGASILKGPYDRSDGRSVYFRDPLGMVGEYLYFFPKKA
ncbi:VOC family protein [Pseudobacteriovorax antillogorgiicola]|uniref:Catechol 2,3-dioxygenase n=1 Tax=Pseudobacteriovorax antillogorgiicola TaxID=1513793 RepID=A0A1Y6B7J2_9BACT|nr:VOC family protein [Pseudobacteriovorax antillogorgiicola]TCS59333.1 catechol 2,3-dioxygenase-like lactoylglutathione lyase family enzyme [Pseudobacteriovorax antillogorgiicola]SME89258.1 Catechol 2,3-dioxygenase [Pseudobacteriovorax antillogorgiicola]